MAPEISLQTVLVPATPTSTVERGLLIFADDVLMAVVMHLDGSVDNDALRGPWYLETGYGPCAQRPGTDLAFKTPDEAQAWVLNCCTRMQAGTPSGSGRASPSRAGATRTH
jgi:hypothetical protein